MRKSWISWRSVALPGVALVVLLMVTLIAALVLAYLITVRNFPAH